MFTLGPKGQIRIVLAVLGLALIAGIGVALAQSITSTSDVRIVAQKLEDGRIEFGLEQDGERILPRARFFPADATEGRWLRSSPIAVEYVAPPPIVPDNPGIGDRVPVGDLDLTVVSIEWHDTTPYNRFNDANVRVRIVATNARGPVGEERTFDPSDIELVDANGITRDSDWFCSDCPDEISRVGLVRGGTVRGYVYFEIPEGKELVELIYEPFLSDDKARIRLD